MGFLALLLSLSAHTHLFPLNKSCSWSCSMSLQPSMFQTQTMQCVIASYSAIRWLSGLMCGTGMAGCGGEIGCSDRAQG